MIVPIANRRYSPMAMLQRPAMLRTLSAIFALLGSLIAPAVAQDNQRSECLAMANAPPRATPVSLRRAAAGTDEVSITYGGHSTYYIDTPGGIRIATDWNGYYRMGRLPDVVTMNRAHSTHYTAFPDPEIRSEERRVGKEWRSQWAQRADERER